MSEKLLVPLDGSDLADAVLPYVEAVGKALGWSVVLLRVVDHEPRKRSPTEPLVEGSVAQYRTEPHAEAVEMQHVRAEEAAAYDSLEAAAQRLAAAGLTVERETGTGKPREIISDRARGTDVGAIVLASHGRGGLARLFRGSVADGVVKDATEPALVVRPFRDEQARVDLEHAERLPAPQADSLRQAVASLTPP